MGGPKHEVIALHKAHPDWTSSQIAKVVGCKREYVVVTCRRNGGALPGAGRRCPRTAPIAEAVVRIARAHPHLIAARIGEIVGCRGRDAARYAKRAGINLPKAIPGNGKGKKTGRAADAVARGELTAEMAREALWYDCITGQFYWRIRRQWVAPGTRAGTLQNSYWMIHIHGVDYPAHRLAWLYVHGRWPIGEIDHINLDKLDNRLSNLREASRSQNGANVGIPAHNTSGFKGVSFNSKSGRWTAQISARGKRYYLGSHSTAEAAARAYDHAAEHLFGEFARTNQMIFEEAA